MTNGTAPTPRKRRDLAERFWAKVNKTAECWEWTASTMQGGYGKMRDNDSKYVGAHRISYELEHGPIPDGMHIDHICHNRLCVRPDHLRLVTRKQNNEHMAGAYRNSKSGIRGVAWQKDKNKWRVQVGHNGKLHNVGYFADFDEAAEAARLKRNELFTHNDRDRK